MTIGEVLRSAQRGIVGDTARLDAELLLAEVLGQTRTYLYTWPDRALNALQLERFEALLCRRQQGEPVAHILARREFWSLPLIVDPCTLIPRPDTELLVECALKLLEQSSITAPTILDLGTGTGAIAVALATELPLSHIVAVDRNEQAVALAKRNVDQLQLGNVQCFGSDWFDRVSGQFDLIVSNPPYIDAADSHLQEGDVRFEPLSALVADEGGMGDLHRIIRAAPSHLNARGWLLLEHGWRQGALVRTDLEQHAFTEVFTLQDYGQNDRVSGGRYHEPKQN